MVLSLEIMCMLFILAGHHKFILIFDQVYHKKIATSFLKWGGGVEGRLEFLRKFIRFGSTTLPLILNFTYFNFHCLRISAAAWFARATWPWSLAAWICKYLYHISCHGFGNILFYFLPLGFETFFIGPESDHWLCLSVTHSLTNSLTD